MFEASINRQFKSRFAALNGVVHMGPISVLRRIFNGHSIDGYVLSNNFEDQLVVMKKKEFESLCKYIKVDIERTSRIPRAKLIKEKGMRGVELNPGSVLNPSNILPYRDVTCTGYSNYLNGAYLNQIQPYTHMILRGMNFSHYEVIYKAMNSNMANAINQAYNKYGTNINAVLSKRTYNAEEYEVALLSVAYVGIEELNPDYLRVICANDGSGAKAMKNKLDKYRGKDKVEKTENMSELNKSFNPYWYVDSLKKHSNKFIDIEERTSNYKYSGPVVKIRIPLRKDDSFLITISSMFIESYALHIRIENYSLKQVNKTFYFFKYSEKDKVSELEKKLFEYIDICKESVLNAIEKGYDFSDDNWYKQFIKRHPDKFEPYRGYAPTGLSKETYNFVYKTRRNKYPLNMVNVLNLLGKGPGVRIVATEWPLEVHGCYFSELKGLTMVDVDKELFGIFEKLANYIDKEEGKLAEENNLSEVEKKERDDLYESWYLTYINDRNLVYELKDTNGYNLNILVSSYTISISRNKTYHNKYTIKLKSDIPNTREEIIICRYSIPLNKLEEELDKILNRYLSKVGLSLESQGIKDVLSTKNLNRSELEAELERLELELETLKDKYNKIVEEDEKDIVNVINMLSERLPLKDNNAAWYIDELLDRPEEIGIQYINYDNYYPTVMFASTDEVTLTLDKYVTLMCIDVVQSDRYDDEGYLRVYPYASEVEEDEIFLFSLSAYDRIGLLWESIYDCRRMARGLYESEALELYDWYRVVNAEKIIEDLKEDNLYEIEKRKDEYKTELQRVKFEIDRVRKKLGNLPKDSTIFGNLDLNDFSEFEEFMTEERPKKYRDVDPFADTPSYNPVLSAQLDDLADLADLFQF